MYSPGSVVGATEINISNLNQPVFALPQILNNTAHPVEYHAKLLCGYTNTIGFEYIVHYSSVNYSAIDPPLQNYYFPSPVITNITNNAAVIPVNSTITRNITIVQQGLNASLDTLYLLDQHTADIQVISCNLGTLHPYVGPGPVIVDTIMLTGSDFPGGNGKFDAGESITVGETVKLAGCTNGQSTLKAAWGCYGNICNFYSAFPSVSPSAGSPDITLAFTPNRRSWGFIDNSGFVEFTVSNTGSGAGGTVFDLTVFSGFSSGGSTYYPNGNWINKIDSFSVNNSYLITGYNYGVGAINGQYSFFTQLMFTFDPDGAGFGLEDADGDGYFDDLPAGKSFTIRAHTYYSWTQAVSSIATGKTCGQGWTNSAWQGFRYGYVFKNQCNVSSGINWVPNTNLNQLMTYNTSTVQTTIPPDLYDIVPVWFEHTVNTTTSVNNEGCPSDSVVYKVVLPPGVIIAGAYTATFKGVSMGSPVISGDSAFFFLDRSRILGGGLFRVPVVAKCEIPHAPTASIHAELKFWCDKKNYRSRYFTYWCGDSPVFGIQCPPGNCPDPSISVFNFQRKTLGWTNDRCTTRILPTTSGIRLDHAMAKDTIRITAAGRLHGPVDSLYFKLKHNAVGGTWGNQLFFDYISDTLRFYDSETTTWFTCSNLSPQTTNAATSVLSTYFGNLNNPGGCMAGVSYTAGDSLSYVVYGIVKNIAQLEWRVVPSLRANFHWKNQSIETSCNEMGSTFSVLGSNYPLVAATNYQSIVIEGCAAFLYEGLVYRTLDVCGGDNGFPNEVRPFCLIDTMTFILPEGFAYQAGSATHSYFLDNGSYKSENIADPVITMGPTGTRLMFLRTSSWGYPDYYDCNSDHDRIRFYASPSCKATGNYTYSIDARGRYQFSATGVGVYKASVSNVPVIYTPPAMVLNRLIGTAEGRQDTVVWKVSVCNARTFASGNNWLGFENVAAGINIVSIRDVTNPAVPVAGVLITYGAGKKWSQLGSFNSSECRTYEIRATYTVCNFDSVLIRHGYNCSAYPVNPELGYPPSAYGCNENTSFLFLDPKSISLNVTVTSPVNPVNLCDTLDYEVEVTNSQLAYGYNVQLTIGLPPGLDILPSFSSIKFPYTTGTWTTISDPVNNPAGSNKWVFDISLDPNGVAVLKGTDSVPQNGYKLMFRVLSSCGFTSGKTIKVIASASNACGETELRTSYSLPILIDGLPTNVSLYVISTQAPEVLPTCSDSATVWIKVINLGPNAVSSIEKIGVNLDDAFDYADNSLTGIHNGPSGIASNTTTGGIRYINFAIQPNLAINDSIVFSFKLNDIDPGSIHCDTLPLETTTLLVAQVSCNTAPGGSCLIQSITSSTVSNIPVKKDHAVFGSMLAHSIPAGTTGETVTIDYHLKNDGQTNLTSNSLLVVFLHDANGNGLADDTGSDSLFSQVVTMTALVPGDSIAASSTFTVNADKVCNMLAVIRLQDNPCICGDAVRSVSSIRIINAGPDLSTCANFPLQVGIPGVAGYTYDWIPSLYLSSPSVADPVFNFAGIVTDPTDLNYILQTTRPGDCISRDTAVVTVYPAAAAIAGNDTMVCPLDTTMMATSLANYYTSVLWTTSGNGNFDNPTQLHAAYTPGTDDLLLGSVTLTLTATGPCGSAGDGIELTFQPLPVVTNTPMSGQVCNAMSPMINLSGYPAGTGFSWTATGSSGSVYGFGPGNGAVIDQSLYNTGFSDETVTYLITPSAGSCLGYPASFQVVVHPVPDVYFIPSSQVICSYQGTSINLLSHVSGTTFSWTSTCASGMISGNSNGTGTLISDILVNTGSATDSVIYTVTPSAFGCPPGLPRAFVVKVKPSPSVTNSITGFQQCSLASTNITLQSNFPLATYTWTASGSSSNVAGYHDGTGSTIVQTLTNTGFNNESVLYQVTPSVNGCDGLPVSFTVTVFPVPDVYCVPSAQTICANTHCTINLMSHVSGADFSWTCTGSSALISGYLAGNGNQVDQVLFNTGLTGTVTYFLSSFANGCSGTVALSVVTVNPAPSVSQLSCFDMVTTTNSKPYQLRGGHPAGGVYSGSGVTNGIFSPAMAGAGFHQLAYTYSNAYTCSESAYFALSVLNYSFSCGGDLLDVRDGKRYKTVSHGTSCWMAENLNRGSLLDPPTQTQSDNCISEKYCLASDPGCNRYGGLYQWDELMSYGSTTTGQGICPPGWHVPTESDWQFLINNVSSGFVTPGDGVAAGFLKDPFIVPGFDALLEGIYYLNNSWFFTSNPLTVTMFWTSGQSSNTRAVARGMNLVNTSVSKYESSRENAFPVRCVKDFP
jgi:uncharacterized protein (TIGR02145 family)